MLAAATTARAVDLAAGTYIYHQVINSDTDYNLLGNVTFEFHGGNTHEGALNVNAFTFTVDSGGGNETRFNGVLSGSGPLVFKGGGGSDFFSEQSRLVERRGGEHHYRHAHGRARHRRAGQARRCQRARGQRHCARRGESGRAALGESASTAHTASLTLAGPDGARLRLQGHSEILGPLAVQSDADIYLGNGSTVLRFAASGGVAWTAGK